MTFEILLVLIILLVAVVLFITEWLSMDVVALLVLACLGLTGLVTPGEALSGFSSPAVVTVWAVLILSGALARTGVAGLVGQRMLRLAGKSEARLLFIIMITAGLLSGFMNSIGVASLFLPVVIDISRRTGRPASKLLMPLAFAALMGGLTTLIGTPPNLLISEALLDAGLQPFSMFAFAPVGWAIVLAGTLFMVLVGRRLLPERDIASEFKAGHGADYKSLYDLEERMVILHLPPNTPLCGKTLAESRLGSVLGLHVIAVIRDDMTQLSPSPEFILQADDRLLVEGRLDRLYEIHEHDPLQLKKEAFSIEHLVSPDIELAEASLTPGSHLIGKTLRETGFRHSYAVVVLAIRRGGVAMRTNLERVPLLPEDVLLLQGAREQLTELGEDADLWISKPESLEGYNLEERLMVVNVPADSPLVGKTLVESRLGDAYGLGVMGFVRGGKTRLIPEPTEKLQAGDTLLVKGRRNDLQIVEGLQSLEIDRKVPEDLGRSRLRRSGWWRPRFRRIPPWQGKPCAN